MRPHTVTCHHILPLQVVKWPSIEMYDIINSVIWFDLSRSNVKGQKNPHTWFHICLPCKNCIRLLSYLHIYDSAQVQGQDVAWDHTQFCHYKLKNIKYGDICHYKYCDLDLTFQGHPLSKVIMLKDLLDMISIMSSMCSKCLRSKGNEILPHLWFSPKSMPSYILWPWFDLSRSSQVKCHYAT